MNKLLYIHIGTGKTGTTALQVFFHENKMLLEKIGLLYCSTGMRINNHPYLCRNSGRDNALHQKNITNNLILLNDEINNSQHEKHLISSEYFPGLTIEEILEVKETIDARVIPVVFLRRQDDFIESWYAQISKAFKKKYSIEGLINQLNKAEILDYKKLILNWSQVNDSSQILISPYEKIAFIKKTIHERFLDLIQMDYRLDAFQISNKDPNPSIKSGQIQIAQELYDLCNESQHKLLFKFYEKFEDPFRFTLPQKRRQEIVNHYLADNNDIANRYLNKKKLFFDNTASSEFSPECECVIELVENFFNTLRREYKKDFSSLKPSIIKYLSLKCDEYTSKGEYHTAQRFIRLALTYKSNAPDLNVRYEKLLNLSD